MQGGRGVKARDPRLVAHLDQMRFGLLDGSQPRFEVIGALPGSEVSGLLLLVIARGHSHSDN
jgi:hypothetical protein